MYNCLGVGSACVSLLAPLDVALSTVDADCRAWLRRWPPPVRPTDRQVLALGLLKWFIKWIWNDIVWIYKVNLPVGSRTRSESTAARLPLQGSKAIGLGHSYDSKGKQLETSNKRYSRGQQFGNTFAHIFAKFYWPFYVSWTCDWCLPAANSNQCNPGSQCQPKPVQKFSLDSQQKEYLKFRSHLWEWSACHLLHFDKQTLASSKHIVLLLDLPQHCSHEQEQQKTRREGDEKLL